MFTGELRPFQKEAFDTIMERHSVVLAYHMGLGKTICTIAAVEELLEQEQIRSALVVTPASLKFQWEREVGRFSDCGSVLVIDGPPQQRKRQYLSAWRYEYVILTYEQVVNDWDLVKRLGHDAVIIDEATAIKNPRAKRTKAVKRLKGEYRIALTGQPVENRPEELFSIMEWVDPEVLGRFEQFDRTFIVRNHFGAPEHYRNLPLLRERVEGVLVRKKQTDPDVRDSLPAVIEETVFVQLDRKTAALYEDIGDDLFNLLSSMQASGGFDLAAHYGAAGGGQDDGNYMRGEVMTRMLCLRMLCDHPDLIRKSAALFDDTIDLTTESMKAGSKYASFLMAEDRLKGLTTSPKLEAVLDLVDQILSEDEANKIVIFSFFKEMLSIAALAIEARCEGVKTSLFTGDLSARQREAEKRRFQDDRNTRVLLSSDAGGYGVDLPQANYLISMDLPWSAGALAQRNSRIIRLSSEWEHVSLINVLIKGSIEERQQAMLEEKHRIASAFLDGEGINAQGHLKLTLNTLKEFLSSSAV